MDKAALTVFMRSGCDPVRVWRGKFAIELLFARALSGIAPLTIAWIHTRPYYTVSVRPYLP